MVKNNRGFSPDFRKDPTRTLPLITAFQKEVKKYVENAVARVVHRLENPLLVHKSLPELARLIHNLEDPLLVHKTVPDSPRPTMISDEITAAVEEEYISPTKKLTRVKIPEAFNKGGAFGDIALGGTIQQRKEHWEKINLLIEKADGSFTGCGDDLSKRMRDIIASGILNEKTLSDISRDLYAVSDIGITRSEVIVKTEIMIAVNSGVVERYRDTDTEEVEWLTVLDEKQCEECDEYDGQHYPIDDYPDCPAHPNCRCTLLPVIKIPEEEPGTPAGGGGGEEPITPELPPYVPKGEEGPTPGRGRKKK